MKNLNISIMVLLTTIGSINSLNAQWYDKSNGLPIIGRAFAIDAYDSLIATGPYTINPSNIPDLLYITTDGGNNWNPRPLPNSLIPGDYLNDISIIGEENIWFSTLHGKIYSTSDGGFNWQLQFYDTTVSRNMNYIEMFDSLNGMAMGDPVDNSKPALFLKTTNGGINWNSQNDSTLIGLGSVFNWRHVNFADINIGYFFSAFENPPKLYKTTNSGKDWQVIYDTIFFNVVKGYDENIILGEEGSFSTIHRTIDGGQNWESKRWNILDLGFDIEYIPGNPSKVWYASYGLSFSNDSGKTWVEEFRDNDFTFNDIVFTDEYTGWLDQLSIGSGGLLKKIYRTTNGGLGGLITVYDNQSNIVVGNYVLSQNYPNPFNPITTINYQIPEISFVTLKVYDVLGNEIATLINEEKPAGNYEIEFDAMGLSSGMYFYQLQAGGFAETKKMVLLK